MNAKILKRFKRKPSKRKANDLEEDGDDGRLKLNIWKKSNCKKGGLGGRKREAAETIMAESVEEKEEKKKQSANKD